MSKNYWLVKQEPESYSWSDFLNEGRTDWTGVRNFQARNNLRAMNKGDIVFWYHSVSEKMVVGIATVLKPHFVDQSASDGDWSAVTLKPLKPLALPVKLDQIKADSILKEMALVKQSRLSVVPMTEEQARQLLALGKTKI